MTILFATDGSAHARIGETLLAKVPSYRKATVHVVSVIVPPSILMASLVPTAELTMASETAALLESLQGQANAKVADTVARLKGVGIDAKGETVLGEIVPSLVEYAEKHSVDLIVAGSRGESGLGSFILGSVTRRLINASPISVLIVRHDKDKTPEETIARLEGKERLTAMVAFDGSDGAREGLEAVKAMGPRAFQELRVVAATPMSELPPGVEPGLLLKILDVDKAAARKAASEGAHILAGLAEHVVAETKIGRPADALVDEAERCHSDLAVIGASRHGMLERFLLGSVAYEVATHAPCSVLIVRPRPQQ